MALSNPIFSNSGAATFLDARADMAGIVAQDSNGTTKAGILWSANTNIVTATNAMAVNITDFNANLERNGSLLIANRGTIQTPIDVAPAANSRIDIIYIKQNETQSPMSDSGTAGPTVGVLKGTAAAIPTPPTNLPIGALALAQVTIPAGATTTAASGVVITQIYPYSAVNGGVNKFRSAAEMNAWLAPDGYVARLTDGSEYKRIGGAWVSQTQSADWVSTFGTVIHLEKHGKIVTVNCQTQFARDTGTQSNLSISEAATFPAWAWPRTKGSYVMTGNNSQVFNAFIDGLGKQITVSGTANKGYYFTAVGSWITE